MHRAYLGLSLVKGLMHLSREFELLNGQAAADERNADI